MKNLLCNQNKSILAGLEMLQKNGKRIVFVVDEKKRLVGVLTDGDVRALLLTGHSLSEKISKNLKNKFIFAYEDDARADVIKKFSAEIKVIPIVNRNMKIVDFMQWDQDIHLPVSLPNLSGNEFKYLMEAFLSTWISSSGEYIKKFETEFAKFCGTKFAVAVSNGTAALHLALVALGIGRGDEVIVPDLTFAATINAVLHTGAKPVIVDVEEDRWTIDPKKIDKAVTARTRAIIPVHLYGQPANMVAIQNIAKKHELFIVEDAAQAHGAEILGKRTGGFGNIGCFSFFGNKVLTTGEGGMCMTNSKRLYEKMRILRDHGMNPKKKYWHDVVGYNYRMTNLQAAIGCAQLEKIQITLRRHRELENRYRLALKKIDGVQFQYQPLDGAKSITWLVSILVPAKKRDLLLRKLQAGKIDARPFFYALSQMPLYKPYVHSSGIGKKIAGAGLNLPTQAGVNAQEIQKIKAILEANLPKS